MVSRATGRHMQWPMAQIREKIHLFAKFLKLYQNKDRKEMIKFYTWAEVPIRPGSGLKIPWIVGNLRNGYLLIRLQIELRCHKLGLVLIPKVKRSGMRMVADGDSCRNGESS